MERSGHGTVDRIDDDEDAGDTIRTVLRDDYDLTTTIPTIRKVTGHRDRGTTGVYVHPTTEHIKKAVAGFSL
ncbi:MAG: hypothetical protein Kow0074_14580 [Candidatus Zixiibacteriota bacterium]